MMSTFTSLFLKDLSLQVKLGCSFEERKNPQEIRVGAEIRSPRIQKGMVSGHLEDTICYAEICAAFRNWCGDREFTLVEKIAHDLYGILREISGADSKIVLTVHKVSPPVNGLIGGVVCRVGDFL